MTPKSFQYSKKRTKKPAVRPLEPVKKGAPLEVLTGYINGIPADSKAEERLANALRKDPNVESFIYSYIIGTQGMPGWKQLDFLVQMADGQFHAYSVKDTEFIHHGVASNAIDALDEAYEVVQLGKDGYPVSKIETVDARDLDTQELADKKVKELL